MAGPIGANATNVGIGVEPAASPINFFGGQLGYDVRLYYARPELGRNSITC